ncbi:MAG: MFS transporter [Dehalococcoidia bacterium]|nr:MFS transporter [Dehalococcoidia bacterium]
MLLRFLPGMPQSRPFYGWAIVAVGALVSFSSGPGQSFVFSVFIDEIIEDTALGRTAISLLYAVGTGVSAFMVFTVSRLADRYGARLTLIGAAVGLGLACFAMSWAQGALMVFLAFSALRALGQGSLTINSTLLAAQWFVRRRGRAVAIMGLGFPASVALLPPLSRLMIDNVGWREAYAALGVMVLVLVLPGAVFVVRNRPEDMGLYPDGADEPPEEERNLDLEPGLRDRRPVLTSPRFWLLALPLSTPSLVVTALVFHQTAILGEQGLSPTVAASIFVPYAVASAGVSVVAGFAVDRVGPKLMFAASMLVLLGAMTLLLFMESVLVAVAYAVLVGSAGGISRIVQGVTWAHFYGRFGLGRIQGTAVMVSISASALGPLPLAWLQAQFDGFRPGVAVMMALPVVAIVAVLVARPPVDREPARQAAEVEARPA